MDHPKSNKFPLLRAARYPQAYVWFIFVSALDLMMTWVVLYFGGREVNVLADYILDRWALPGMVVYKFTLVVLVIFICEVVGHYRPGRLDSNGRDVRRRFENGLRCGEIRTDHSDDCRDQSAYRPFLAHFYGAPTESHSGRRKSDGAMA